jgi:DNA-binding NarL/FixJ family response regulator
MLHSVIIVEDHEHLAVALVTAFNADSRFRVLAAVPDIAGAVSVVPGSCPNIAIVDVNLPDGSGLNLIPILLKLCPGLRCLVFSQQDPLEYAQLAQKAGAAGYLSKGASLDRLLEVATIIAEGGEYFPRIGHP